MKLTEHELRAIHELACAAVLKSNRATTPADEAFWPAYILAILEAHRGQCKSAQYTRSLGGETA